MSFEVKMVCDSVSPQGVRLTTMSLRYPRFIHAEVMTHRVYSRNASSSRAIPVKKIIGQVQDDPAMPIFWGSNQPGMQAGEEISRDKIEAAQRAILELRDLAVEKVELLVRLGLHKQIANRYLEPWHHIQVVITGTDWTNFFSLRCHPAAQPEMKRIAEMMCRAYYESTPKERWIHLPYVQDTELIGHTSRESILELQKLSTARCARVSYMKHDGTVASHEEDFGLYKRLIEPGHMSPSEHPAVALDDPTQRSGNFIGWLQHRKTIPGENRTTFEPGKLAMNESP